MSCESELTHFALCIIAQDLPDFMKETLYTQLTVIQGSKGELWGSMDKGDLSQQAKGRDQGMLWGGKLVGIFFLVASVETGKNVTKQSLYFFQPQKDLYLIHICTAHTLLGF